MRKRSLLPAAGLVLVASLPFPLAAQRERFRPVTDERIRANAEPENWLVFRRSWDQWGNSPLAQIEKLPALTPASIEMLLNHRERQGGFKTLKEIQEMLGADKFERIKGYLIVRTPHPAESHRR